MRPVMLDEHAEPWEERFHVNTRAFAIRASPVGPTAGTLSGFTR
jgi:hypothetical protein